MNKAKTDEKVNADAKVVTNEQIMVLIVKAKELLAAGNKQVDENCTIENYVENAEMLEWAGIGFNENTNMII